MKSGGNLEVTLWLLVFAIVLIFSAEPGCGETRPAPNAGKASARIELQLDHAVPIRLPATGPELKALAFKTSDGKDGWVIKIPGAHPIATPAYADGMVFVGGGYGSHEFYAFDAQTGALVWKVDTSDDGPTAAVVEGGYVAFNTESCTVIVVDEKTGKIVWQQWLGDPLMSQPAIYKSHLFIAYPGGQRSHGTLKSAADRYRLLSIDLKSGRRIWEQPIPTDVISAPVIADDKVYITCFDGTSYALNAWDGAVIWKKYNAGTSAPVIADGEVIQTRKEKRDKKNYEGLVRIDAALGKDKTDGLTAKEEAAYLAAGSGGGVGLSGQAQKSLDSLVGFSLAPASAEMAVVNQSVGVSSVVGGWAYQGSRAVVHKGRLMNAQGHMLNSVNAKRGDFAWRAEVKGQAVAANAQVFAPPALGNEYLYLSGPAGYVVSLRQRDGKAGFLYSLNQPMAFQPALARGNMYIGTNNGLLVCLKTGSPDADGWYAWGGNAQHNK